MAFRSAENLHCPICLDIFKDPVLLTCSHSFCKACWERLWTEKRTYGCPVCKTILFSTPNPPRNLALKNLCEDFLLHKEQRRADTLCNLHLEELKLFCLEHQEPVCLICLHSSSHTNHSFRPINEAAQDYKVSLGELLKPLQRDLESSGYTQLSYNQPAKDIEVQAQDTERQIKETFLMLQKFLQNEEQARISAVREEKKQKSEKMRRTTDALRSKITALSDIVRSTEEVLRAEDLTFLQKYKTAAEKVGRFQ